MDSSKEKLFYFLKRHNDQILGAALLAMLIAAFAHGLGYNLIAH